MCCATPLQGCRRPAGTPSGCPRRTRSTGCVRARATGSVRRNNERTREASRSVVEVIPELLSRSVYEQEGGPRQAVSEARYRLRPAAALQLQGAAITYGDFLREPPARTP